MGNQYDLPVILTVHDLIQNMKLSTTTLAMLLSDESFPIIHVGTQRFILRDSLLGWLKTREATKIGKEQPYGA